MQSKMKKCNKYKGQNRFWAIIDKETNEIDFISIDKPRRFAEQSDCFVVDIDGFTRYWEYDDYTYKPCKVVIAKLKTKRR